jgi:hypothetical protein
MQVIKLHRDGSIKGQRPYKVESGGNIGSKLKVLKSFVPYPFKLNVFHCLAGILTNEDRKECLEGLLSKSYTYEEFEAVAKSKKGVYRVTDAIIEQTGEKDWVDVASVYPYLATHRVINDFISMFSGIGDNDKPPAAFRSLVRREMRLKETALSESVTSGRDIAVDVRDTEDLHMDFGMAGGPSVHVMNCDAMELSKCPVTEAQVINIDPFYGIYHEDYDWDRCPISKKNLTLLLNGIYVKYNCDHQVFIVWCTLEMATMVCEALLSGNYCKSVVRLVWSKQNAGRKQKSRSRFDYATEMIIVGFSQTSGPDHRGNAMPPKGWITFQPGEMRSDSIMANVATKRMYTDVGSGVKKKVNRCQKPVWLCVKLLKHFSKPGDTVIDVFAGTGKYPFFILIFRLCVLYSFYINVHTQIYPYTYTHSHTNTHSHTQTHTPHVSRTRVM